MFSVMVYFGPEVESERRPPPCPSFPWSFRENIKEDLKNAKDLQTLELERKELGP